MPGSTDDKIVDLRTHRENRGRLGPMKSQSDALNRAQELVYQAWEADDPIERVEIAEQALKVSPLCADAWGVLAEDAADSLEEEIEFYREGVKAGERSLGETFFTREKGKFWGLIETRPYMRARAGLAHCLWDAGEVDEAIGHYRALLELNPSDNQGTRFLLLSSLVLLGRHQDAYRLMDSNPEDEHSAMWAYSRALLGFRQHGDRRAPREARAFAVRANRHVPAYLGGTRKMPKFPPDYVVAGDKTEAVSYVYDNRQAWFDTPGAVDWLLKEHDG